MTETQNALATAASSYLRSAQHQPIHWHEWGSEAFSRAQAENKPILLDIGAVWCHWCHVMDRESYENLDTAAVINDFFIAIKVDRDERPDIDARYQAAVAAISGGGGWPLTAFLTPDGRPYFGGTYFPPEERLGRPSFQRVLLTMASAYSNSPEEVLETAASVMEAIEHNESFSGPSGELGEPLLNKLLEGILSQFDERNGGFASQPKFPHPAALDLLIDAAGRGNKTARKVAEVTLKKMAAGGIHDQLAGGFHRYSTDERWIVPHFEKMAYDNSELLKNYAHAYATFGDEDYAQVARSIIRWMDEVLSDRVNGGFYASQDADDSLDDDGDYYTWTRAEAEAILTREEFFVAAAHFNLRPVGDMHHNPQKNVLHIPNALAENKSGAPLMATAPSSTWVGMQAASIAAISHALKIENQQATTLLETAKAKMYAARLKRKTPFVDKTIYTGWNAMCCSAYLQAGRILAEPKAVAFALKSLDRAVQQAWNADFGVARVVAYGEGIEAARIPGVLEDYAFLASAALDAWEATGKTHYYTAAKNIADAMLACFYDASGGGFFDTEKDESAIGALTAQRKPLQDSPTPSGNAVAATLLLRLFALTEDKKYEDHARQTLETFAGVVEHFGLYAASYGLALRLFVSGTQSVSILGDDATASDLEKVALKTFAVGKSVVRLNSLAGLPPALRGTLPHLPLDQGSLALVCRGKTCVPPVNSPAGLHDLLCKIS